MKHITDIINDYITENRISKAALAREMGVSENSLWKRLNCRDMTVSFVQKISTVLNHNFFSCLVDPVENEKEIEEIKFEVRLLQREKETLLEIIDKRMK